MSLIDDLARVREMQGREPLPNPHVIAGFEPGTDPVPAFTPSERLPTNPIEDPFLDGGPPEDDIPASPLVPRRQPETALPVPPDALLEQVIRSLQAQAPKAALAICDREAIWKGRAVTLSETDEKAVRAVVLRAIQREVQADLDAVGAKRVRRTVIRVPSTEVDTPKRRGRPRRSP